MSQIEATAVPVITPPLTVPGKKSKTPAPKIGGKDPLALPKAVDQTKIDYGVVFVFGLVHLLAAAALIPWLFSWTGVGLFVFTSLAIGMCGINICYHRLLTHRSFTVPVWFERVLTLLAFCNLEGSSLRWVATHRMHHQHSDHQPDPHSPLVDFIWAHMGWMIVRNNDVESYDVLSRYAGDLAKDKFHNYMHTSFMWFAVWIAHAVAVFAIGFGVGYAVSGEAMAALQMGLGWLVWGVFLRNVFVWHITWAINSVTHVWGYKNYKTTDDSRNNWLMGFLAFGEGWHNNHHADQRSARAGHKWWELDLSYMTIKIWSWIGLADNIVTPARNKGTKHDVSHKALADDAK